MSKDRPLEGLLFLSDLDGTLLYRGRLVPQRSIDAIERFKRLGGRMSVATGRTESSAARFVQLFEPNAPAILYNGAALYDFSARRFLRVEPLGRGAIPIIRRVCREFPDITVEIYTPAGVFLSGSLEFGRRHMEFEHMRYTVLPPEQTPGKWMKVLFAGEEPLTDRAAAFLEGMELEGYGFVRSAPVFCEMLPGGVDKGSALLRLAGMLGIPVDKTFAIGDYYNDLGLLRAAGTSFTVRNAPEEIRKMVNAVVGTCEEGAVADALEAVERHVLPRVQPKEENHGPENAEAAANHCDENPHPRR